MEDSILKPKHLNSLVSEYYYEKLILNLYRQGISETEKEKENI